MPVIKGRRVVSDPWQLASPDTPLPDGALLVEFAHWRDAAASLAARPGALGVVLTGRAELAELAPVLSRFELLVLRLADFNDGRAFSIARLLREQHGFTGELRACGSVLPDQLPMLERCGFDSIEVDADLDLDAALASYARISDTVQPVAAEEAAFGARWAARG